MIIDTLSGTTKKPYFKLIKSDELGDYNVSGLSGWIMDWSEPYINDYNVVGIFLDKEKKHLEGLMSLVQIPGSLEIFLLESSPSNKWSNGERSYRNVGKALVAFGCLVSWRLSKKFNTAPVITAYGTKESRDFYESINAEDMEHDHWVIDAEDTFNLMMELQGEGNNNAKYN